MVREEQIKQKSEEISQRYFPDSQNIWARQNIEALLVQSACCEMAKWVDENPNKKLVYTKQELLDMGFGFDLNGNIRTPNECYESAIKYTEYRKQKLIDKGCKWMKEQCYQEFAGAPLERLIPDELIEDYIKTMEDLK